MSTDNIVTEALVNRATGEVVEIGLQKTPDEIMGDASEAAKALERVISSNKRKLVEFNGKRFLEFPHWQTIGRFFHTTVSTHEAEFVKFEFAQGFKAKALVIDEKTGMQVGCAEAYCLNDEPNWKHKPLFQLASMAQTRAACKALSNKYRYVAILAGYEPTPGEEIDMSMEKSLSAPKEKPAPIRAPEPIAPPTAVETAIEFGEPYELPMAQIGATLKITDKQRKMLFAKSRDAGITEGHLKDYLWSHYNLEHTADLNRKQFTEMLLWVDEYKSDVII